MRIKDLRIIIDERERKSGIPKLLQKIGINVEVKTLPIGDYIVSHETVVERKVLVILYLQFLMEDYSISVIG